MDILKDAQQKIAQHRSLPFWSWNDKLDESKLLEQIDWMKSNDIGGFFIHARTGLKTDYLSEDWMKCVDACTDYARQLGMEAWIYDENGWPSGFVGGKLLENIENHDRYLTYKIGEFDKESLVSYLIDGDNLIRAESGETSREYLNLYENYSTSTVDILNPEVTKQFLNLTHQKYKDRYGDEFSNKIHGFFTDEPQYYRWGMPYSPMIRKYFTEVLNLDILDDLGLLFFKKTGYAEFRYQYWSGMQHLLIESYAKKVYTWCEENGVKLTGHYIEESTIGGQMMCCAGIMPLYEYEHIPGIDWLGRYCTNPLSARQVSSVAAQLGKKQVLCEMYACAGWDVSPRELKIMTEYLYHNGINLTCQHLIPYSEFGNRLHDYPAHYYPGNPWVAKYFSEFNSYFSKLGAIIGNSSENVKVALLHPIRSAYLEYEYNASRAYGAESFDVHIIDDIFSSALRELEKNSIPYHILDETILKKYGKVKDNEIICGNCHYKFLILSGCTTMDRSTEQLLKSYCKNGGKVMIRGKKPSHLEGELYNYTYLENNLNLDEIIESRDYSFSANGGDLSVTSRKGSNDDFLLVLNKSMNEFSHIKFMETDNLCSFKQIDILSGKSCTKPLEFYLQPGESVMLFPQKQKAGVASEYKIVYPSDEYQVIASDDNALVVDYVCYSYDGHNFSNPLCVPLAFQELLKERFCGRLYLRFDFEIQQIPNKMYFNLPSNHIEAVYINGFFLPISKGCIQSKNIKEFLKCEGNSILVEVNFYQNESVYETLFGENILESIKNCLVYNTEIEPLILRGDFGVYEKKGFRKGKKAGILLGRNFWIGSSKKCISSLVKDGFPFFSGTIVLKSSFYYADNIKTVLLNIPGIWHAVSVRVNGHNAGVMLTQNYLNISDYVISGENLLELDLTFGNRNLFGPHHYASDDEAMTPCPAMFEFPYESNKKNKFRDDLAFIEQF